MPHKQNPVGAMWARAGAKLGRAQAAVLTAALVGEHERAGGAWQAEWDALSGALASTGGAASALASALDGLEVDGVRMRANLDLTGGLIVAERLASSSPSDWAVTRPATWSGMRRCGSPRRGRRSRTWSPTWRPA